MPPKKLMAWCGDQVQLRVEQIPEQLWRGHVLKYPEQLAFPAGPHYLYSVFSPFVARSEEAIKHGAVATVLNSLPQYSEGLKGLHWRDLSELSDEEWHKGFLPFLPPAQKAE